MVCSVVVKMMLEIEVGILLEVGKMIESACNCESEIDLVWTSVNIENSSITSNEHHDTSEGSSYL